MRVRCTRECFIFGVLHQPGDEFDWPHKPEDYMIPLENEKAQQEESAKASNRGRRRTAGSVTE